MKGSHIVAVAALVACGGRGTPPDGSSGDDTADPGTCPPAASPRFVRMTHVQYDNAVRDLFGIDTQPSAAFVADVAYGGFVNNAEYLVASDRLVQDWQIAAEGLAKTVATNATVWDRVVPCAMDAGDAACAEAFVDSLGRRMTRRPLSAGQRQALLDLFTLAEDGLYEEGTPFQQGVRVVVEALLQSPEFLYRKELAEGDAGVVPLDGYDLASKLAALLWNSIPDDALLDAAAAGELDDRAGVETWARAMVRDPRARSVYEDFHRQWLQTDRYGGLQKDPVLFPAWNEHIGESLVAETDAFVTHVAMQGGTYRDLLTMPVTFVDDALAPIYGVEGPGPGQWSLVDLDPERRGGLFTQVGFLAAHAHLEETSPIHRGVFVHEQILCRPIPDPPSNISDELPDGADPKTTREEVEILTGQAGCADCHDTINPPGFAFEHYDAIGQWRDLDRGHPVDASGTVPLAAAPAVFDGAVDFLAALAEDEGARRCYTMQWWRYAYARVLDPTESCAVEALHAVAEQTDYTLEELLVQLTLTDTFRSRVAP